MGKDAEPKLYTESDVRLLKEHITRLMAMVEEQAQRIEELELQVARMQRNSSTSSKPPSSDITKPPKGGGSGRGNKKRKPGGQPGHKKHERELFKPDEVDDHWQYTLDEEDGLDPIAEDDPDEDAWRIVQQINWAGRSLRIVEHRARRYRRIDTGRIVVAPLPEGVRRGELLSPGVIGLIAYLKGACHLSYSNIRHFFREVMGIELCVGLLVKAVTKAADALAHPYQEVLNALPTQPVLGVDETGHRHMGQRCWTWCLQAPGSSATDEEHSGGGFTFFAIAASRGSGVVKELLGTDYAGVIVCDYFSAYRKCLEDMEHVEMQFCWSHLIRDLKFLLTLPASIAQKYGNRVLKVVRRMFGLWHRRGELDESYYRRAMQRAKAKLLKAAKSKSNHPEVRKLAARLTSRYADAYFTFMDYGGVDPTNNRTEQQIRFVVIDRKVTQGTKAEIGKQWCERIWTTLATCRQRGKQLYRFLVESIEAKLGNRRCYPSLIY